eukprot:CAMPEP_0182436794 /NCGR_PEP_ID=MMETSP1167-20130531/83638_1 /TAXON_ID=2988 /ORGANISM="Mallomonas Sp, Strain CCMP3275" /LENGTH=108 /DNA_ID=CAMNT_0024629341 /DNA_START=726 /DNA_END=1049 /DNA_ORIENTATION=-
MYGFHPANINFYVPLTSIYGTNSLVVESSPGGEDWHAMESHYGQVIRFWGAQCAHFTTENCTATTRVSLDFRVIEDNYWDEMHDQYTSKPGYYTVCELVDRNDNKKEW